MARKFFTDEDLALVERAITEAESRTSGEIVPLVVTSSDDYAWVHWFFALAGFVVASMVLWFVHRASPWSVSLTEVFFWQGFAVLLSAALPFFSPLKRLAIPSRVMDERVDRSCMAHFLAQGLHETRDRTGVLIYLSLLEHRVEILADRGIHDKVGSGYWEEQVAAIVRGIRAGRHAEGLREAILGIGAKLAEDFPPRPDDTNEHSNEVRFGDSSFSREKR